MGTTCGIVHLTLSSDMDPNTDVTEDARPFRIERVVREGRTVTGVPAVVKCVWTPIKTENLLLFTGNIEDARSTKGCHLNIPGHEYCRGHLCVSNGAYLIPYGFAVGGEIVSSDGSILNQAVINGDKEASDVSTHCYDRIKGKRGILRKSCNGCRPVNTFRLVASPMKLPAGWIEIPPRVMRRGKFMYVTQDGRCRTRRLMDGMVIAMGRCPSQGADSALPMRITTGSEDVYSVRIPAEVCKLTNADFDGDEMWMLPPMTEASSRELEQCWNRVWAKNTIESVFASVDKVASDNGFDPTFDSAMLTTMTFEEMGSHPGGKMYQDTMLKPKSWKEMYKVMVSKTYWKTHVMRSENGIMNTIMSRHGLAGPYGFMRMGMMLGTCVNMRESTFVIDSTNETAMPLPLLNVPTESNMIPCSSAITKLTKIMYQSGIDTSKHGSFKGKTPAISTLLDGNEFAYGIADVAGTPTVALMPSISAYMNANLYTNLSSITRGETSVSMLERACMIVGMIEEIDSAPLTDTERMACAFLLTFLSTKVSSVMGMNTIDLMSVLGLDWYTSATCSDVRWIRDVMRKEDVTLSTDISSVLGSIFLGNMSLIASKPIVPYRTASTAASMSTHRGR